MALHVVPGYDQQQPFVQAACLIDRFANSFRLSKPVRSSNPETTRSRSETEAGAASRVVQR